jgi:hypothetical protein
MHIVRPAVRGDSNVSYIDKAIGKQLAYTPKTDEEMVTFEGSANADIVCDIVRAGPVLSVSQGIKLNRGFAAAYVRPGQDRAAAERSLAQRPEIANAMPVLIDEHGASRYVLPDELTAQFADGVQPDEVEAAMRELGSAIVIA